MMNFFASRLSIQYDGDWTPDAVKKRIVEVMYSWTLGLPKETKIAEAYKMLKQQGKSSFDLKFEGECSGGYGYIFPQCNTLDIHVA